MTAKELLIGALKETGYDGLCSPEAGCGCGFDDLMPCGGECVMSECVPAYKSKCKGDACEQKCEGYDEVLKNSCFSIKKEVAL